MPERYNVDFVTGAGNVEIFDIEGEVNGKTGAGNVDISDMEGSIDIISGAGNIDIEGVSESVEVNTGAGNIDLEDVTGFVRAKTGAGNITARISEQPDRVPASKLGPAMSPFIFLEMWEYTLMLLRLWGRLHVIAPCE